jgi:hypothetical protein
MSRYLNPHPLVPPPECIMRAVSDVEFAMVYLKERKLAERFLYEASEAPAT